MQSKRLVILVEAEACARIAQRDVRDWRALAAALLDCPIWTEDQDFFGTGGLTSRRQDLPAWLISRGWRGPNGSVRVFAECRPADACTAKAPRLRSYAMYEIATPPTPSCAKASAAVRSPGTSCDTICRPNCSPRSISEPWRFPKTPTSAPICAPPTPIWSIGYAIATSP